MHEARYERKTDGASKAPDRPNPRYVTWTAPLLLALMFGLNELTLIRKAQDALQDAARKAARLTVFEPSPALADDQSANERLVSEVKNILAASDVDPDRVRVSIVDADDSQKDFNLEDPQNLMRFFQVRLAVPCSEVLRSPVRSSDEYYLATTLTFRNTRPRLTQ